MALRRSTESSFLFAGAALLAAIQPIRAAEDAAPPSEETPAGQEAAAGEAGAALAELPDDLTQLSLEELTSIRVDQVYGAAKHTQKVTEAPSSVTVITADDIDKLGYRNLADVLRGVRGLFTTYDRNYAYLGVRGFNRPGDFNSRILLLVDGHRINDNVYQQAKIGYELPLDVDLIDRIEIIRGPGSALYGSSAFFAVINVITKRGVALDGAEAAGAAGSFDTYRGRLSFGTKLESGLEVLLSATGFDSEGQTFRFEELADPSTQNGIAKDIDDESYYSLFGQIAYKDLTLQAAYVTRDKDIPTASYGTVLGDRRTMTRDNHAYADLKYHRDFEAFDVLARLYVDNMYYQGKYAYQDGPSIYVNKDRGIGSLWGSELKLSTQVIPRNRITAGIEVNDHFQQDQKNFDSAVNLDDQRKSLDWGLYGQDELKVLENLHLTGGVRVDHYETFGFAVSPRAALVYSPVETTALKLLYGQAFRAPNAYELYYADGISQKANKDLDPEKIHTYELVLEQYFLKNYHFTLSAYHYDIEDLISQETDPSDGFLQFRNVDEVRANGLELELEAKLENGLRGSVSYAVQRAEDDGTDKILTNSPEHIVQLHLVAPLYPEKVFAGLEGIYVSRRKTLGGDFAEDYLLVNLTLFSMHLLDGLEVSATLFNVFDREYEDPGGGEHVQGTLGQDGRAFWFQLSYRFGIPWSKKPADSADR